jgi:hypothetical protein
VVGELVAPEVIAPEEVPLEEAALGVRAGPEEVPSGEVALGVRAALHPGQAVGELVAPLAAEPEPALVAAPAESPGIPETAAVAAGLAAGYRRSTKSRTDAEISLR